VPPVDWLCRPDTGTLIVDIGAAADTTGSKERRRG